MESKLQKLLDLLHNATSTVLTYAYYTTIMFYSVPTPLFLPLNEYLVFH